MGLQNEGAITGGDRDFAVALRSKLDLAGFGSTIVDCCDSHDFSFVAGLNGNHSSPYFKAVGALAVHEPLRNAEKVQGIRHDAGPSLRNCCGARCAPLHAPCDALCVVPVPIGC